MNVVLLVGRLTRDPEMRYTTSAKAVTKLSVATNEKYGETEHTEYHSVIAWEKTAEAVSKLHKGEMVAVQGRLQTRKFTDKAGIERRTTEIVASRIDFLRGAPAPSVVEDETPIF